MSNAIQVITGDIYAVKPHFESVLSDRSISFEREAGFAVQIISGGEYILKVAMSNRQSVIDAVTNIAAIGISLNPAKKQAYLVPRDGKVCLDISYMGLMDLAIDSGSIKWAQAELVYSTDVFSLNGFDKPPTHTYSPFHKERGDVVGVYVVAKTADGDYLTAAMSTDEINAIRDRSSAWKAWCEKKKKCPWVTDWGEMAKKTVVKRAYKYWPKTERLEQAIHHLNTDGGEGLADITVPDTARRDSWVKKAQEAETIAALSEVWKAGVAEIKAAGDRLAYAAFKAEVESRSAALRQPDPEPDPQPEPAEADE